MQQVKLACESTTAHGLPRIVASGKPMFIRIIWLLLFLLFLAFFIRSLVGLVTKLQNPQVTSSLEASSIRFRFPDVYVCFESAVSGTYAASMNARVANEFTLKLLSTKGFFDCPVASDSASSNESKTIIEESKEMQRRGYSYFYPTSMPYQLLVDALAHRAEQSVISSDLAFTDNNGFPAYDSLNFTSFYHPNYLRCFRWTLGASAEDKLLRSGSSAGVVLSLLLDGNASSVVPVNGSTVESPVFMNVEVSTIWSQIPLSEWSFATQDWQLADRRQGARIFLASPGEYPSDFTKSYLLAPGKYHVMYLSMSVNSYSADLSCLDSPDGVQFYNPYDQSSYSHNYSYSYCYYYEYHKAVQQDTNFSGIPSPLPWPLKDRKYFMNLTGHPNFMDTICSRSSYTKTSVTANSTKDVSYDDAARSACLGRDRCSLLVYDATISSADWPTPASLSAYLGTTVAKARAAAAISAQATPALDFLVDNATTDAAAAYVRSNLLKVFIRPSRVMCDRLVFAYSYSFENFIADVGGIAGVYLGLSLLTVFELIDLFIDLIGVCVGRKSDSKRKGADFSDANGNRPTSVKVTPA